MKHFIASAALAACLCIPTVASATELKVTAREAGVVTAAAPEEVKPGANTGIVPPDFKVAPQAASQYVIVATIKVEETPVMQMKYRHEPFADEAACKAFIESDDGLKTSNAKLEAVAKEKVHPDAKVGVSCEEDSD